MKLIPWETPFFTKPLPSVLVRSDLECCNSVELVVAPYGIYKYPKYRLSFETAFGYRCTDESFAPVALINRIAPSGPRGSTYRWLESAWLLEFEETRSLWDLQHPELFHFSLLGGDLIVEVIAPEPPGITEVSASMELPGIRI